MPSFPENVSSTEYAQLIIHEKAETKKEITNGVFCPKCKKHSMISYQVQIRRGDEGTNTFDRCTNCGHGIIKS